MELGHLPVMPDEVLGTLAPAPGSLQIDATVGGGGHTERILEAANPDGRVLGLDADQAAIDRVAQPPRRGTATGSSCARRTSASWPTVAPGRGLRRRRRGAVRPRAVVVPARRPRARLRVPHRRPARHALRHHARRAGVGAARDPRRRRARRPVPHATARSRPRGRSPRRSSRPGRRRRSRPPRTSPQLDRARLARQPAPATPHPPGHARVPGAADRGQRGARRASGGPRRRRRPAAARRPPRRPVLPLARGPDRQALLRRRAARLHLPARGARSASAATPRACAS